ncbi:MAG: MafI family immunity protein [Verrucomicrobia bacterium]|nr:MafI family immunity protein [Verrucomicrobiota bacterium]
MDTRQSRIDRCNQALEAARSVIPADLYAVVYDCINRHDEAGLGIETLIDGLSELELRITSEQFALIEAAMDSMGLADSSRVSYLRDHNVAF